MKFRLVGISVAVVGLSATVISGQTHRANAAPASTARMSEMTAEQNWLNQHLENLSAYDAETSPEPGNAFIATRTDYLGGVNVVGPLTWAIQVIESVQAVENTDPTACDRLGDRCIHYSATSRCIVHVDKVN